MNCCNGTIEQVYTPRWGRIRCGAKYTRLRLIVFSDDSPCNSPFDAPTGINWIDYFPVAAYKLDTNNAQIEDRKATIDIICDNTQKLIPIFNRNNKVSLIDMGNQYILCSGKIRQVDILSNTDVSIEVAFIRDPYSFERIFSA